MQYANLGTSSWGEADRTIEYTYDDNGSLLTKTTEVTSTSEVIETVTNHYNLANRLDKVTTELANGDQHIVEYTYNDDGIRVRAYSYDIPYGQGVQNEKTVVYLVDAYNHTGYAQTLEEMTFDYADPDPLTETPDSLTTYLIGDDVFAQNVDGTTQYLLYDGHGSTRQLAEYDTSVSIAETFAYDGYGVLLQDDSIASQRPGYVSQQATSLMYAGEYFDSDSQQYYNRARWYNPLNGIFNRVDPFSGSLSDPQSLHKYLYCHANPINNTDPSGMFISAGIGFALTTLSVVGIIATVTSFALKAFSIGMGFVRLKALGDFMIELNRAPMPDLITKLQIRSLVYLMSANILKNIFGLSLKIVQDGLVILAFSILLRATIGFLRCMKNAAKLARSARSQSPITDPSRLLPSPKINKHHIFPKEYSEFFNKAGIYIDDHIVQIEETTHLRGVHGRGLGELPGRWNKIWGRFFDTYKKPTALQIFQQAGKMMDDFGLSDLPIVTLKSLK